MQTNVVTEAHRSGRSNIGPRDRLLTATARLNAHSEPSDGVAFSVTSDINLVLLRQWGRLRTQIAEDPAGSFKWYVVQNRPGQLNAAERNMLRTEMPFYIKYPGHHTGPVPFDLKAPLILIFSNEQYKRALRSSS